MGNARRNPERGDVQKEANASVTKLNLPDINDARGPAASQLPGRLNGFARTADRAGKVTAGASGDQPELYVRNAAIRLSKPVESLARGAVTAEHGNPCHTVRHRFAHDALCRAILTCACDGNLELTPGLELFEHTRKHATGVTCARRRIHHKERARRAHDLSRDEETATDRVVLVEHESSTPRHVRTAAHFGNHGAAARPLFGTHDAATEYRLTTED
jgi:hypothetical protein